MVTEVIPTTEFPDVVTSPAKVAVFVKPKLPKPYKVPYPLKGKIPVFLRKIIVLFRAIERSKFLK